MPIRLYHPDLEPPSNECEVQDENQVAILAESGWKPAPEPAEPRPGYQAEPVQYAPVDAKPAAKRTAKSDKEASD